MTKDKPFEVDILIKKNERDTIHVIENCTAIAFAGKELIKDYKIGSEITLMLDNRGIYTATITDLHFRPSTANNTIVLEIFV